MTPRLVGALISAALIAAVFFWYSENFQNFAVNRNPEIHKALGKMETSGVPNIESVTIGGSSFNLQAFRGKLVIINFWATWCNPCAKEFPSMFKLVDHFKDDVVLVAVSNDESQKDIVPFLSALGGAPRGVHVLWDPERKIANQYGVEKLPESFLVGKDGKLVRKIIGIENWYTDASKQFFESLIR